MTILRPHPEERLAHIWLKCPTCGYCEKINKDLTGTASSDKLDIEEKSRCLGIKSR